MDVSENRGTPKSSILIGFSMINHPFWGIPIFGNTQIATCRIWPSALCAEDFEPEKLPFSEFLIVSRLGKVPILLYGKPCGLLWSYDLFWYSLVPCPFLWKQPWDGLQQSKSPVIITVFHWHLPYVMGKSHGVVCWWCLLVRVGEFVMHMYVSYLYAATCADGSACWSGKTCSAVCSWATTTAIAISTSLALPYWFLTLLGVVRVRERAQNVERAPNI